MRFHFSNEICVATTLHFLHLERKNAFRCETRFQMKNDRKEPETELASYMFLRMYLGKCQVISRYNPHHILPSHLQIGCIWPPMLWLGLFVHAPKYWVTWWFHMISLSYCIIWITGMFDICFFWRPISSNALPFGATWGTKIVIIVQWFGSFYWVRGMPQVLSRGGSKRTFYLMIINDS